MRRSRVVAFSRRGVELARAHGVVLVLAASLAVNVVQARQLGESKGARSAASSLVGARLGTLPVLTPSGGTVDLSFRSGGKPTIVYYFSPTCGWCERNWKSIAALSVAARDRFRFVAITTGDDARFAPASVGLHADVYGRITDAQRREMRLGGTPHTLVVATDGRIIASWAGAFGPRLEPEVERYFGLSLPGLTPR